MDVINVTRSSMPAYEEYCAEIRPLWESRWLTNLGVKHRELQEHLTHYLGVEHMELVTNGHMALELALQALGLQGEVITTPFTFASTTQAILRSGLTPVFCDIDRERFTLDPSKLETLVTERTCAILPVHVYGTPCDVDAIEGLAKRYGLKVLYDAAHAFGVRFRGAGLGACGDASCFSFHATKVFHTVEGGGVCFHNVEFGERLSKLRNFGIGAQSTADELGSNAKMDEFRAAMGLCNLRHIDEESAKRGAAAARYRERLEGVKGLQLTPVCPEVQPNYAYFPVLFHESAFGADRETVFQALASQGIMARKYFFPLTSTFPCYGGRFDGTLTPVAAYVSQRILTLPLYADLALESVDRICDIVLSCRK